MTIVDFKMTASGEDVFEKALEEITKDMKITLKNQQKEAIKHLAFGGDLALLSRRSKGTFG